MANTSLKIKTSVVVPDSEGCVHLLVQNPTCNTFKSPIGVPVGQVELCIEISPEELVENETNEEPVGLVNRIDVEKERKEEQKDML